MPIPTLFAEESTTKVGVSQIKSPVPPVKPVSVPKLVMFVCAAVVSVAFKLPLTVRALRVPTDVLLCSPSRSFLQFELLVLLNCLPLRVLLL